LNHPNICTVYEIDEDLGFLAIEFIPGETVEAKRKRRPLPIDEAIDIALQTAAGLQAAHENGIVHRDIKSANLMLTGKGQVKVMDFGLARLTNRTRLTRTGYSLGTPAYMAPELFRNEGADERSDIWSLGVVIYEMIAGKLPFAVMNQEPEPLTSRRTDVPVALDLFVKKAPWRRTAASATSMSTTSPRTCERCSARAQPWRTKRLPANRSDGLALHWRFLCW
jgi:serine/threonine protein kinase